MLNYIVESQFKLINEKLGLKESEVMNMFRKNEIIIYEDKKKIAEPKFKYIQLIDKYSQIIFIKI